MNTTRRQFIQAAASLAAASAVGAAAKPPRFDTRGVVLLPFDLTLADWPQRAARAGLNTLALHACRRLDVLVEFVKSEPGRKFLGDCRRLGLRVEYELHAMGDLLSRELWYRDAGLFRVDASGRRNHDCNCCPSNPDALAIIAESAVRFGRLLRPTTHRYFYWPDDGRDWCSCAKCKGFSASEQALLVENAMLKALHRHLDPAAQVCHIAYHQTLPAPAQVKPEPGVFVEFAPIERMYSTQVGRPVVPLSQREHRYRPQDKSNGELLDYLDANLAVFPRGTAQALDYWMDVSLMSTWKRPAKKHFWSREALLDDLQTYARRGIRHVTSFACFMDADYVKLHGDPQPALDEYGAALKQP
jgi:hypothetical protein